MSCVMGKPVFGIFSLPLYSDIIFFIDYAVRGYQISIAYCLFSFRLEIYKVKTIDDPG